MRFEWDENKSVINLQSHGIDFADVWRVFESERVIFLDDRFDYNELRFVTIGVLRERIITIVYTENNEITRIISVRKATKNEQRQYREGITNRLGED